ncbi:MAG: CoA pyrophosphatase [Pirellulales bacterium]|nr:CoA pyrophosphatase [Pirellulales bacterium]
MSLMNEPDLTEYLVRRLAEPLPGRAAQSLFEPELSFGRHYSPPPPDARSAAVLALLYWHQGQWHLPLMLRPGTMIDHANQVSFPGGMIEEGEDSYEAAVRELREELGVREQGIVRLGALTPLHLFVSNFQVLPYVAMFERRPDFTPNADEVAEVLEVPLAHLLDPANSGAHRRKHRGLEFRAPHYQWQSHQIWGATSMMLAELMALIGEFNSATPDLHSARR